MYRIYIIYFERGIYGLYICFQSIVWFVPLSITVEMMRSLRIDELDISYVT